MTYVTVPNGPYPEDTNRVVWTEPDATNLWNSLIDEANTAGASSSASPSKSAAALGQLRTVMELELLGADATGTSSPGGADVGTCPVS
jgi:hypothetical protein